MSSWPSTDLVRARPDRRSWAWHLILLAATVVLFAASPAELPDRSDLRAYLVAIGDALGAAE
jgi:hypothetical protein